MKRHNIHSTEYSVVDFTLSKDDGTGDITIRYASPKELKFAFDDRTLPCGALGSPQDKSSVLFL